MTDTLVATCAHVVARASEASESAIDAPAGSVRLDFFPLWPDGVVSVTAEVHWWEPVLPDLTGDIALLRLATAVPGAQAVPLVAAQDVWQHSLRVVGFPAGRDHGLSIDGRLLARQGLGWIEMVASEGAGQIERGFSGSPVWDNDLGGVVGMTVAADGPARPMRAYLIPASALGQAAPRDWPCPYRGLEAFTEDDACLFYGRDQDVVRLRETMAAGDPVAVIGPSGSGKSSLVRAGLLPELRAAGMTVTELRPLPGTDHALTLAAAMLPHLEPGLGEVARLERAASLAGLLRERPELVAGRLVDDTRPLSHLMFLDQLEELSLVDPAAARELLGLVIRMSRAATGLSVVVTLRWESIDEILTTEVTRALRTVLVAAPGTEALRELITGPATTVPGLAFEPGLVERIVEDAGTQPGRLALVEFTLTLLWHDRPASTFTHAAYDRLGGVRGALADHADKVYRRRLAAAEQPVVARVFVQLARPLEGGRFVRRAARMDQFDPSARPLVRRLADARLLVIGPAPDGHELVDLAHEALLEQWPRLHAWLTEARNFRAWQEQVRPAAAQWDGAGREPGALLRGGALDLALEWLATRPDEITPIERLYVERSRSEQRRGIRRWRAVAAVVTALAVAAGVLSAVAWRDNARVHHQLRVDAAVLLAQESAQRAGVDPGAALQLSLAAWRNDPGSSAAYGALLRQYVALGSADRVPAARLPGRFRSWAPAPAAGTLVVTTGQPDGSAALSVWTGMLGDHPRSWTVPTMADNVRTALSPDGRMLAVARPDGSLEMWDVIARHGPFPLRTADSVPNRLPVMDTGSLAYSGDGTRLLQLRLDDTVTEGNRPASLDIFDVPQRRPLPTGRLLVPDWSGDTAAFAGGGSTAVVVAEDYAGPGSVAHRRVVVRDIGTATVRRSMADRGQIANAGHTVASCDQDVDSGTTLHLTDTATGAVRSVHLPVPCDTPGEDLDATGRCLVTGGEPVVQEGYETVTLVDLADGHPYEVRVPSNGDTGANLACYPQPSGQPVVLAAIGDEVVRLRPAPIQPYELPRRVFGGLDPSTADLVPLSPDQRFWLGTLDELSLVDARSHAVLATRPLPRTGSNDVRHAIFTADARSVAVLAGHTVTTYAVPGLTVQKEIHLPEPPDVRPEDTTTALTEWNDTVMPGGGPNIVVYHGGSLSRWNAESGGLVDAPFSAAGQRDDPEDLARSGLPLIRPGHPDQAVVVTSDGTVRLYDLRRRAELSRFAIGALGALAVTFDQAGDRVAAVGASGTVTVWNVDQGRRLFGPLPTQGLAAVVGFGPNDILVTLQTASSSGSAQIWDLANKRLLGSLQPERGVQHWLLHGDRLTAHLANADIAVPLNLKAWLGRLCSIGARDFTDDEHRLLPPGSDTDPPCTGH